jgi:hypothetical protein
MIAILRTKTARYPGILLVAADFRIARPGHEHDLSRSLFGSGQGPGYETWREDLSRR